MMWLQRSRLAWLREGDRNTSYVHRQVVWRARKNKIHKIKRGDGTWCEDKTEIKRMITDFYKSLYIAQPMIDREDLLQLVNEKITIDVNEALCHPFFEQEIANALF